MSSGPNWQMGELGEVDHAGGEENCAAASMSGTIGSPFFVREPRELGRIGNRIVAVKYRWAEGHDSATARSRRIRPITG
jgi:hypothetical protein